MSVASLSTRVAAPVMEVFASIQGEGAYVGEPQVLVRLRGCPLRCRWCDTPGSWTLAREESAHVAAVAGARREGAWATPFQVACWIREVEPSGPRTVSVHAPCRRVTTISQWLDATERNVPAAML